MNKEFMNNQMLCYCVNYSNELCKHTRNALLIINADFNNLLIGES